MIVNRERKQKVFILEGEDESSLFLSAIPKKDIAKLKDTVIAISMTEDEDGARDIKLRQNTFEYELVKISITGWSNFWEDEEKTKEFPFNPNSKNIDVVLDNLDAPSWEKLIDTCKTLSGVRSLTEDQG